MTDLAPFGKLIQRLINRQDLDADESYQAFRAVLLGEQPDLHQGAFLAALTAKGETAAEIAGAWRAIMALDTVDAAADLPRPLVENSGTGMDTLKTFNVSSAAAVIAAACGVSLARHGARALTSSCGTIDLLEACGVGVDAPADTVCRSIREAGIGVFNGMSPRIHPRALGRILSQIRFGSTLNIAASLANPARPDRAIRGVYNRRLVPLVAGVMREIGIERGMVVHGCDAYREGGMDELSISGPTHVTTFSPTGSDTFTVTPEDVGLRTAPFAAIAATGDLGLEKARFFAVLDGTGPRACVDMACLNAAAAILVGGRANDLAAGVRLAQAAVAEGRATAKFGHWLETQPAAGTA